MENNLDNPKWLEEMYASCSIEHIAGILGVHRNTVRNRFIKFGIVRRQKGEHFKGVQKTEEQKEKMSKARKAYWDAHQDREEFKMKISAHKRKISLQKGYPTVYIPGRHVTFAHRYVMEQVIGRELTLDERVHHINGDKMDNRIENLQLVTCEEHSRIHNASRSKDENGRYT